MNRLEQIYNSPLNSAYNIHKKQINDVESIIYQLEDSLKHGTITKQLYNRNKKQYDKINSNSEKILKLCPIPTPLSSDFKNNMKECDLLYTADIITNPKIDIDKVIYSLCKNICEIRDEGNNDDFKSFISKKSNENDDLLDKVFIIYNR